MNRHARFPATASLATLSRSMGLLRSFPSEQADPARFYGGLAEDTAELIAAVSLDITGAGLAGASVLDVGGGPGYFADAFHARGAGYVGLEPDVGEMSAAGIEVAAGVRGDGAALPFRDDAFDVVYSSNVAEHVPDFTALGDEMVRVTRPGGLAVLSYTVWLGPFGGHETGVWETTWAGSSHATATRVSTVIPRRTCSARRCSTSPAPTGWRGRGRWRRAGSPTSGCVFPAITRRGRGGWCGCRCCGSFW